MRKSHFQEATGVWSRATLAGGTSGFKPEELMESLTHFSLEGTTFVTRGQETSVIKLPSGKVLELLGF